MLRAPNRLSWIAAFLIGTAVPARAEVELVSGVPRRFISDTAGADSWISRMSADGRWLAFLSNAPNLVPGQVDRNSPYSYVDTGGDVFLHDRATGTTILVSRSTAGPTVTANWPSEEVAISADGRFVAFASRATDLVDGLVDENEAPDIFLYDRVNGTTERLSDPNDTLYGDAATSGSPVLSADGRYVAFVTGDQSAGLEGLEGDKDDEWLPASTIFLYDRVQGTSTRIVPPEGSRYEEYFVTDLPSISADGRWVAFWGDTDSKSDVFLYDRVERKISLVSHASSSPTTPADGDCEAPSISADGAFVVYRSKATNLVPGQGGGRHGQRNVFLFQRSTGKTALVSHARSSPVQPANSLSGNPRISADGSWIVFDSKGTNLVAGQSGEAGPREYDVFLYRRVDGSLTLLSRSASTASRVANAPSSAEAISADGSTVLFLSQATDLVAGVTDVNGEADVFRYDRRTGRTELVSHPAHSAATAAGAWEAEMSANGQWIAWSSAARDLVSGVRDTNETADLVLEGGADRTLVSLRAPDLPSSTSGGESFVSSISADGRFVAFVSSASLLVAGQRDSNGGYDVFLRDRLTRTTTLVSRSTVSSRMTGNRPSFGPSISADGRFLVFRSEATDLVAGQVDTPGTIDSPGTVDVFLYDRVTGSLTLASRSTASPTASGSRHLDVSLISADGSSVFFQGHGDGFVPGVEGYSLFVYDRISGQVSRPIAGPGGEDVVPIGISISADGRFLAFTSSAPGLDPGAVDTNEQNDVFLHDRASGKTTLLSRSAAAPEAAGGFDSRISADGQAVAFVSAGNVFLYDRISGTTSLVSRAGGSPSAGAGGGEPDVSADGRFVAFASSSPDILPGQNAGGELNVYLFDRTAGSVELISRASFHPRVSTDGRVVAFLSRAPDLVPGQSGPPERTQLFLRDRATGITELVSRSIAGPARAAEADVSEFFVLSGNGEAVVFDSPASDLVANDHNLYSDVFVYTSER